MYNVWQMEEQWRWKKEGKKARKNCRLFTLRWKSTLRDTVGPNTSKYHSRYSPERYYYSFLFFPDQRYKNVLKILYLELGKFKKHLKCAIFRANTFLHGVYKHNNPLFFVVTLQNKYLSLANVMDFKNCVITITRLCAIG